jgi:hypothetical protein
VPYYNLSMKKIPEKTLGTVGRCIYCHTDRLPLKAEHIIPFGLNGPWKLLDASCGKCEAITSRFERDVLKTTFDTVRIALDFPSRRKKNRPKQLPLTITRGGKQEDVNLAVEEYPAVIGMPHFEAPAYLAGRDDEQLHTREFTGIQIGGPPIADVGKKLSAQSITFNAKFEPVGAFARLLAKIAYGCAVVAAGCDLSQLEDVYVLPAILGKADDVGRWVGGTEDQAIAVSDLHDVKFSLVDGDLLVNVRLFAQFNAPEYVVVGRTSYKSLTELELPEGAYEVY